MADRDLCGRTLGEYILREQIGEGGHAVVYRGEQPALQRDVVVKVLHERRQRSDASRERFLREAQLASRLDHPYAAHVHVYDSGAFAADLDAVVDLSAAPDHFPGNSLRSGASGKPHSANRPTASLTICASADGAAP